MKFKKTKLLFTSVALILVAFMALPSIVKISHAAFNHIDLECKQKNGLHLHEVEFDCDFQDFALSFHYYLPKPPVLAHTPLGSSEQYSLLYSFLSEFQKYHDRQRGPPGLL